jgi:hypothetical protein
MLTVLQLNIADAKRAEERSDRALQLFMALLTALFGANVVVYVNVQDVTVKSTVIALSLVLLTGLGILTFVWILSSDIMRREFSMERYHLFLYFRDQDSYTFVKYGQEIYSLNPHHFSTSNKFTASLSMSVALSLGALGVFVSLAAAGATYLGLQAFFGEGNLILAGLAGSICVLILYVFWWFGNKAVQTDKTHSIDLLKKYDFKT